MLCVTISERMVRKTSRPMRTGRQTLTKTSSPTNARSPTTSVAHGSRCPPPPKRTERRPRFPPRGTHAGSGAPDPAPNCESAPIATTSSPTTVARGPSFTPSSTTTRGATTSESSPRSTPSPIRAPASRSAATFSPGASCRNASGSKASRNAGSSAPSDSSSPNVAGSDTRRSRHLRGRSRPQEMPRPSVRRSAARRPSR